jgi:hypothetical protein
MHSTPPTRIDKNIISLLRYLELENQPRLRLKKYKTSGFSPEINNCHINNMVQCHLKGGSIQFGWVIWENQVLEFTEAMFHSVWRNRDGKLIDITPRQDGEKKILFVPDPKREVSWTTYESKQALKSYDNVRLSCGQLVNELREATMLLTSSLMNEFTLFNSTIL